MADRRDANLSLRSPGFARTLLLHKSSSDTFWCRILDKWTNSLNLILNLRISIHNETTKTQFLHGQESTHVMPYWYDPSGLISRSFPTVSVIWMRGHESTHSPVFLTRSLAHATQSILLGPLQPPTHCGSQHSYGPGPKQLPPLQRLWHFDLVT